MHTLSLVAEISKTYSLPSESSQSVGERDLFMHLVFISHSVLKGIRTGSRSEIAWIQVKWWQMHKKGKRGIEIYRFHPSFLRLEKLQGRDQIGGAWGWIWERGENEYYLASFPPALYKPKCDSLRIGNLCCGKSTEIFGGGQTRVQITPTHWASVSSSMKNDNSWLGGLMKIKWNNWCKSAV